MGSVYEQNSREEISAVTGFEPWAAGLEARYSRPSFLLKPCHKQKTLSYSEAKSWRKPQPEIGGNSGPILVVV